MTLARVNTYDAYEDAQAAVSESTQKGLLNHIMLSSVLLAITSILKISIPDQYANLSKETLSQFQFIILANDAWVDVQNPYNQVCKDDDMDECPLGLVEYTTGDQLDLSYMDRLDVGTKLCVKVNQTTKTHVKI